MVGEFSGLMPFSVNKFRATRTKEATLNDSFHFVEQIGFTCKLGSVCNRATTNRYCLMSCSALRRKITNPNRNPYSNLAVQQQNDDSTHNHNERKVTVIDTETVVC